MAADGTATALRISVPGATDVSALHTGPSRRGAGWTLVYAPGAGSNLRDPFGAHLAEALPARGVGVLRFQFPYMEAARKSPDRPAVLEQAWRAALDANRAPRRRTVAAGRSMGGRIASQVAAAGAAIDALILFAYPLHPPGKPDQPRTQHLSAIKVPTLIVSGSNDSFGSPDELRAAAKLIRGARVHILEGADHGFAVRKSSGRTRDDVFREASAVALDWLFALP